MKSPMTPRRFENDMQIGIDLESGSKVNANSK